MPKSTPARRSDVDELDRSTVAQPDSSQRCHQLMTTESICPSSYMRGCSLTKVPEERDMKTSLAMETDTQDADGLLFLRPNSRR